jgi:hypothetical protein
VQALFDQLPGVPDVLVNNAATSLSWKRISESVVDNWWGDMVSLRPELLLVMLRWRLIFVLLDRRIMSRVPIFALGHFYVCWMANQVLF